MVADVPARVWVKVYDGVGSLANAEPRVPADHERRGSAISHDILGGDFYGEALGVQRVAEVHSDFKGIPRVGAVERGGEGDRGGVGRGSVGGAGKLWLEQPVHGVGAAVVEVVGHALELWGAGG